MEVREQIRRIKYLRLKPEERFLIDILNKVKKGYNDKHPNSTFFSLNNKILFEQDDENDTFWVRYNDIWSYLMFKHNLNTIETQHVITHSVWNILKMKVKPVHTVYLLSNILKWDKLKLKTK